VKREPLVTCSLHINPVLSLPIAGTAYTSSDAHEKKKTLALILIKETYGDTMKKAKYSSSYSHKRKTWRSI
jgi:hypothetical protein